MIDSVAVRRRNSNRGLSHTDMLTPKVKSDLRTSLRDTPRITLAIRPGKGAPQRSRHPRARATSERSAVDSRTRWGRTHDMGGGVRLPLKQKCPARCCDRTGPARTSLGFLDSPCSRISTRMGSADTPSPYAARLARLVPSRRQRSNPKNIWMHSRVTPVNSRLRAPSSPRASRHAFSSSSRHIPGT